MLEKLNETLAYKSQLNEEDTLPKEAVKVSVDKEYVKLQHNGMILDPEMALEFAQLTPLIFTVGTIEVVVQPVNPITKSLVLTQPEAFVTVAT